MRKWLAWLTPGELPSVSVDCGWSSWSDWGLSTRAFSSLPSRPGSLRAPTGGTASLPIRKTRPWSSVSWLASGSVFWASLAPWVPFPWWVTREQRECCLEHTGSVFPWDGGGVVGGQKGTWPACRVEWEASLVRSSSSSTLVSFWTLTLSRRSSGALPWFHHLTLWSCHSTAAGGAEWAQSRDLSWLSLLWHRLTSTWASVGCNTCQIKTLSLDYSQGHPLHPSRTN